jgi:cytochrome c553
MIRSALAALAGVALGAGAAAQEKGAAETHGRHLARECTACHRPEAPGGAIPSIAGKPAAEIIGLLQAYRDGRKTSPVMTSVARSLNEDEMAALAAYFSSLPTPANSGAPPP